MTAATITRHRPTLTRRVESRGPYAPVPYCDEHNRRATGCEKCRRWSNWRLRIWRRRVENGERTTVPIEEVRDHIAKLNAAGMKNREILQAAGMGRGTFEALAYKTGRKFAQAEVAQKLLDIPVPAATQQERPRQANFADATGSLRRIRALHRIGWTQRHIAEASNLRQHVHHIGDHKWVTNETAAGIRHAYDLLSMKPGPSARTALRATRRGWPPPLAWDDATIDDPNAQPADLTERGEDTGYDETTVAFAVDGRLTYDQIKHNRADLIETVRRLAQRGVNDIEIAHHLRWPGANDGGTGRTRGQNSVCKFRERNGIPGPEKYEAVYAYTTRDRDRARRRTARQTAKAA